MNCSNLRLRRRQLLRLAAGAAALPALARIARAQAYPSRPVRLIFGFAAGGSADIVARLIAQFVSGRLGQPVIVENRTGASSNLAGEAVAVGAGRLHAAVRHHSECDQRHVLRQSQVRFETRLRAGLRRDARAQRAGGQSVGPGQQRCRVHRLCKSQSRKAEHGIDRQRHVDPSRRRTVQGEHRHQSRPRALSQPAAGDDRSARRPGAGEVRRHDAGACAYQGGPPSRARGDDRNALGNAARRADPATKKARGAASARLRERRPRSSISSTGRSMSR